ncbi:ADP-ribosylation factor-like protein 16 isoform X4 [Bos mutus]|uniref:ADP-ribosylation factor-like protein 16 isoform X4 n=1 Tax=Bos mutus TaxID=72004 RepID=UPI0038B5ACDE
MCLLLGATGVGKSLLVKRLQIEFPGWEGRPGRSAPDAAHGLASGKALVVVSTSRFFPQFMVDASNPTQLSASCVQLLGLLSAEELAKASVLILFNKIDLPCYMTIEEMKSLIRLPDLMACAKQNITTLEISAWKGTGLSDVLRWLQDTHRTNG